MRPLIALFVLPSLALTAPVIGISDGDTLTVLEDCKPVKIRLANIDVPEKAQPFGTRSRPSLFRAVLQDGCELPSAGYRSIRSDSRGRHLRRHGGEPRPGGSGGWLGCTRCTRRMRPCRRCRSTRGEEGSRQVCALGWCALWRERAEIGEASAPERIRRWIVEEHRPQ